MSSRRGLAGSSALMFSGTLVSRLLGMVREPLLLGAAIGINYGAANAFAVANRLPNLIHLLIAGGVLNAVLVPQIVRAMKGHSDGGQQYVNRLLTVSAAVLGAVTVLLTAAATVLVSIYASELPPQWFDLAVVFAVWTIPQLFFYGMYTVLGQVLNARGNFGPYMWAPAANNVVAIGGLVVYLLLFGGVGPGAADDASAWTAGRVAVLAGTATLGVVAQAVILLWPLHRSGFRFRPEWGLRNSGLGRASRVAMWVFGSVVVGQLVNILVVRAAVHAANRGGGALDVPGPAAYNPAYTLFILPNSLVVVSLITALFTRMSSNAATGRLSRVRDDLSLGLRTVGLFTVFGTGALMVLALPIMRVLTVTVTFTESRSIARVAVAMLAGLVGMGALTVVQRVYYAFEDTRRMFWIQLPAAGIVAAGAVAAMFVPPEWTLVGVGVAMTVSNTIAAAVSFLSLRRHLPSLDGGRVLRAHVRLTLAATPAVLLGWGLLHLLGVSEDHLTLWGAVWRTVLVGAVMGILYLLLLRVMRVEELTTLLRAAAPVLAPVTRRLPAGARRVLQRAGPDRNPSDRGAPPPTAMPAGPTSAPPPDAPGAMPVRTLGSTSPKADGGASTGSGTLSGRDQEHGSPLGVTVLGERYQLGTPLPATLPRTTRWRARDLILDRDVEATILHPQDPHTPAALDAARRAATVQDPRLLDVLDVGDDGRSAYLVTDPVPGAALDDVVAAGPLPVDQARAVVGELASALETARRQGVQHLSLRPEAVRVTTDDRVVVTGLAVDAVLLGTVHDDVVAASRQDAVDLVRLLYLALTARWPQAPDAAPSNAEGAGSPGRPPLPAAPTEDGTVAPASSLRADVPEDLDALCADVLRGRPGAPSNPAQIIHALAPWDPVDHGALPGAADRESRRLGWRRLTDSAEAPVTGETRLAALRSAAGPAGGAAVLPARTPEQDDPLPEPALDPSGWWPHPLAAPDPVPPEFEQVVTAAPATTARPARHTTVTGARAHLAGAAALAGAVVEGARKTGRSAAAAARQAATAGRERYATVTERRRARAEERAAEDVRLEREREARQEARDDQPVEVADGYLPPHQRRIDPTPVALGLVLLAVAVGLGLAVRGLTAPMPEPDPPATSPPPVQAEPEPAPEQPEPEPAPPEIATLTVIDPQGDGAENPELTPLAMDGDASTFWRSRRYDDPQYGMKDGIGLVVGLAESTQVQEVELTLLGEGGLVQVIAAGEENAPDGDVLAEAEMSASTVLTFDPVGTDEITLWFPRLPVANSDGLNRIELAEVAVR